MIVCLYSLTLFSFLFSNVYSTCQFENGKYDLSSLDRPSGWPVPGPTINGTNFHYEINLCRPLSFNSSVQEKGCPRSSVCLVSNNSAVSFGNSLENISDYAIAANIGTGFSLYVLTNTLCKANGKYRANINFVCGPHLGSPELILTNDCQVNFMWRTSAACSTAPKNQVPCYVLDDKGNKRDLSPLIINNEGYSVYTPNAAVDFIINVCSALSFNSADNKCPPNAAACRVTGKEFHSFGSVSEGLKYTSEGLVLTYITEDLSVLPPGCTLKPKTTIFFKCPIRGYSQPPKLISDSNCQYEVVWETEYACPENLLKGDLKSCQFTLESHGVEIDLSPLREKSVYNVTSPGASTYFLLSVCSGLGGKVKCNGKSWKSTSVCVYNSSNLSQIGGSTDSAKLLYADGEVLLKYVKGDSCNGTEQTSVINFKCDLNATNNGDGEPQFIASDNCSHIFEWSTKHACLKHPLDTPCSVTFDKKKVNLQKLLLVNGEPWEAIDGRPLQSGRQGEYFINVCGPISKLGNYSMCGNGSAACVVNEQSEYINLGNFTSPPIYDRLSDSVRLIYSGGSLCGKNKHWQSSINFICKPGQISSKPILIRIDETECRYDFEWQTADACPTGLIKGSDCKVIDNNLGIKYDLNPLRNKVYQINSPSYEFYLGVCEPVKESPCTNKDSSNNIGVCQVDKTNNATWKTYEPTSHLTYIDGVVNLTYLSGDPYYNQNHTARVTIIIFICDFNAGNGNPRFIEVEDFAFIFHWYTSLVCPQPVSSECLVHDPFSHDVYDLSGLSLIEKNWKSIINESNKEKLFYINVCRSLALPITGCDPTAAACLTERDENGVETVVVSNLGHAINPPVIQSAGHITLTYTDGNHCVSYGNNSTYITAIHFFCDEENAFKTGLKFLSKVGSCEYSFLWPTKAACPTGKLRSNNSCQLTDPDSGFTFDLMPLYKRKEPYSVPSPSGGNFQFNICGKVNGGCFASDRNRQVENVSVCEVDSKGKLKSNLAFSNSVVLSYTAGRDLTLTYKSEADNLEIIISFPCFNLSSSPSDPKLMHYESGQYIFELKTKLTCIPEPFDCNVLDNFGYEYDFTPLAKYNDANWEVSDFRPEYSQFKYHINFCRPLNKLTSYKCPAGASSACQTSFNASESMGYDLGSQIAEPMINGNGTVVFHYSGGSYCHDGQFKRSTTITLFCVPEEEGELKFIGETPECEYVFTLETPAACPLESSRGENCLVKEPIFGYTFNLNPLKNKNNNYNVTEGEFNYVFNVCDKLNGFDNKCANSSACQLKSDEPNFSKSLGLPNDVLVYRRGLITLEYKSGSGNCHGKYDRTTKITFLCHHAHEDRDGPIFVDEAEDCTYLFEWPTVHACPPFDVIECSVVDDQGVYYDLSRLSLPYDNYYIKYPEMNKTFIINVCRSVVHTPHSICPYTSAACLSDSLKSLPVNLGGVSSAPYFNNGSIKIKYTFGDPCVEEIVQTARFKQSIIEFICDPSLIDSEPEFVGKDGCTYYFYWHTAYACPPKVVEARGDCTVKDPITGYVFNLSSLKNHGIFKHKSGDHQYFLNVCGNDISSPCGTSAGMCQEELSGEKRHWMGGKLNYNLTYNNGILFLNYTEGGLCHDGRFQRNTLIEFHCGEGTNEPQFLYESHDCTYFFSWKTELACQTHRHCAIKNGSLYYDLISLAESHHTAASAIINDNASYYISVCNSLEEIAGVYCPPGAAICRISRDATSSSNVAESLGKLEYPPFVDFMGHATIIYTNGSTCLKSPDNLNRARIIFLCEANGGIGEPVLIEVSDDCVYLFEWRTNAVCAEKPELPPSFASCNYSDSSRGIHLDLLPLKRTGTKPYYEILGENMSFKLNICAAVKENNLTKCRDSGVCGQAGNIFFNYGIASSQKFTYSGGRLRLTFYDGDDCPSGMNGKRTAEIFFVCDPSVEIGEPTLHKRYTCLVIFMWKTSLVCHNMQRQCAFDVDRKHYDFNLLSSLSHNWITTDANNITYWINMCRGIQQTDDTFGCSPTSAICMMNRRGFHFSLGTLQSMKVKSLNSTDLLLTFENGDSKACFYMNSASTMKPVTRLFMRCGRSLGQPQIFSGPDNKCYYDFVWESILACADPAEEIILAEKDGIIKDERLAFTFNIKEILNRTFTVPGASKTDRYVYKINLSGGVSRNMSDPNSTCYKAGVCQTKPNTFFERDIGSFDTRAFIVRGAELLLVFKSRTRPCGKNRSKEVTTLINMQCSSAAGIGSPEFIYESGNCDYIFEWPTIAVCPDYYRKNSGPDIEPNPNPYVDVPESHHKAEIAVGVMFGLIAAMIIIFIIVKAERRAIISSRFRGLFGRVNLPYFRYKRCEGEKLVLVDASRTVYDDEEILHC